MKKLHLESSLAVSTQITATCQALDNSIAELATLTQRVLDVSTQSQLAPSDAQKTLAALAAGFHQLIESRQQFVQAHRAMIQVKSQSDHAETGFGCLGDRPLTGGEDRKLKIVA